MWYIYIYIQNPELRRLLLSYSASTNEDSGSFLLCSSYSLNVLFLFPHQQNFGDPHDDHICSGVWRTWSSVAQREFQEWDLVSPQTAAGCSWLLVLDVKNWHSGFAPHRARINLKQDQFEAIDLFILKCPVMYFRGSIDFIVVIADSDWCFR